MIKSLFLLQHEMVHFTKNLQVFLNIEVIESAWKEFLEEMETVKSLDEILRTHDRFVDRII